MGSGRLQERVPAAGHEFWEKRGDEGCGYLSFQKNDLFPASVIFSGVSSAGSSSVGCC